MRRLTKAVVPFHGRGSSTGRRRRGVTIVMPLAACVVAALITASLVQLARIQRQHLALQERRVQAVWYLESGLQRAVALRRTNVDFVGDEWTPPGSEPAHGPSVRIQSRILPFGEGDSRVRVECVVSIATQTENPVVLDGARTASVENTNQE
jgi:hypothetical protein